MDDDDATTTVSLDGVSSDLEVLRAQCDRLTATDAIDKTNALGIVKLFHSAEVILRKEAHEIEILKLNSQFANTVQDFNGIIFTLRADVDALRNEIKALRNDVEALKSRKR